ncbi:hypothetical protein [Tenacibaculum caenipelagi]|uniref:Uncharacterized protein n=1 Tax=Tenacibaculum caenipelagi TaxID=1325435 RepID=A0A4R6TG21_9FLAO|nr:hypothetical protein [Tenacibaculum caenipelagi]TDQ27619.1 hypothetical protein DFQ07_1470 [Tenacibaculum caenipelagi]
MKSLKETLLKKYGVWEYVVFLVGLGILSRVLYSIIIADFKNMTIEEIGIIILFLSLGIIAIAAPLTILEFARKKAGLQTRKEKLEK